MILGVIITVAVVTTCIGLAAGVGYAAWQLYRWARDGSNI